MNKQLSIITAGLVAMAISGSASAVSATSIVEWDLSGAAGNESFQAAASSATNVLGMNMTRGAGLTANAGSNSFNSANWTGEATDYFSFGFTIGAGYEVDLGNLTIGTRSSGTGPGTLGLYYSGNGFTSALYTFNQAPGNNYVNNIVDLSILQDLTGNVEFRIAQVGTASASGGTTGTSGTFRIAEYYDGANYYNVSFDGAVNSVAAVPEADTYALMLVGLGLVGFMARHRKA